MKDLMDESTMDPQDRRYQEAESPSPMPAALNERTNNASLHAGSPPPLSEALHDRVDSASLHNGSPVEDDKGMYSCDKCQYKAKQRSNLMRHYYTMHADLADHLECCGQFYRTKGDFRQHVKTVHKQGYLCKICNRTFSRKALLKRHSYVHNGIREFKCEHCNYATSHKSNLERHFKVHTPLLRKRRCRLSYRISNGYQKHLTVEGRPVQSEPTTINDNGCSNFLGLSSLPYQRYGVGPLPGSGHPWAKFPITVEDAIPCGAFPTRSSVEDYESILKLQLMSRKQIDVRRNSSIPSSELAILQNLSNATHKQPPLRGPPPPPPPPPQPPPPNPSHEGLQARLSPKEPIPRGAFPTRSSVEDYESILKLQLMSRKQIDVRRNSSIPSSELSIHQNLSTATQKHAPLLGPPPPHPPPPPPPLPSHEGLQTRLSPKESAPMIASCEPNCFCAPMAMWMLPIYQGFLSHEIYSQLSYQKSVSSRSHPHARFDHSQRGHFETPSLTSQVNADSASHRGSDERSIYLDLLKMQENVVSRSETIKHNNNAKKKQRREVSVIKNTDKGVSKSLMNEKTVLVPNDTKLDHKVPQSDQPLKKRYKRFFVDNIK